MFRSVEVSARERLGLDDLLEMILLVADVNELKANPYKPASGVVIEAKDRPQPWSGGDRAGAERHAQCARYRGCRRDLGPRQGDVRRPRQAHAPGGAGDAGRNPGTARTAAGGRRFPVVRDREGSQGSRRAAHRPAAGRSRRRRSRREADRALQPDPERADRRAPHHPQGRRDGLAAGDPDRRCSSSTTKARAA